MSRRSAFDAAAANFDLALSSDEETRWTESTSTAKIPRFSPLTTIPAIELDSEEMIYAASAGEERFQEVLTKMSRIEEKVDKILELVTPHQIEPEPEVEPENDEPTRIEPEDISNIGKNKIR